VILERVEINNPEKSHKHNWFGLGVRTEMVKRYSNIELDLRGRIIIKKRQMEISALSSGSSGNCFYLKDNDNAVLIDAGISCSQIVERLQKLRESPERVRAIFITHEHSDHIRGADVFSRTFNIPIFVNKKTSKSCFLCKDEKSINIIKNEETIEIGGLNISSFSKSHNAADPVFYEVSKNNKKVSIITDLGYPCKNVTDSISDSDFLCLESNHDMDMLEQGPYPIYLKRWIKSDSGHLSNLQSSLSVLEYGSSKLKNLMLCHLSQENNTRNMALSSFDILRERTDLHSRLHISSRLFPSLLVKI
jgi:phosphoribosyl 1,2-cyclic phosphodiesterase